jgi:hypothetical protein
MWGKRVALAFAEYVSEIVVFLWHASEIDFDVRKG